MTEDNQSYWTQGVKNPRSPVGKIKLSDLMNYDPRCSYKHKRVWEFHLGWSHADYEHTSLASVRKIYDEMTMRSPAGRSPLSLNHINLANRDLCDWGYITLLAKGTGRNASRFSVNWSLLEVAANGQFPSLCHPVGDANDETHLCHPVGDSAVTHVGDASDTLRHPAGDKDLSTPIRVQDPDKEVDRINDPAIAAVGLGATAQAEEREGKAFDRLYNAYDVRKKRADAKAAFEGLPDNIDIQEVIAAAKRWREAWVAQNNPSAPRKYLHTWLRDECYLEDAPTAYKPKDRGPKAGKSAVRTAENDNIRFVADVAPDNAVENRLMTIKRARIEKVGDGTRLCLDLSDEEGLVDELCLTTESNSQKKQEQGQKELASLCKACGLERVEDTEELVGHMFLYSDDWEILPVPSEKAA